MKADYKNWVPLWMLVCIIAATIVIGGVFVLFMGTDILTGQTATVVRVILGILFAVFVIVSLFYTHLFRTFSYNGKRKLAKHIIDGISDNVVLPDNGKGLDIGCGSGALTIACAKKNKNASMYGLDRWGNDYLAFTKERCEDNAKAEGVEDNTHFVKGDACKLDFPDEYFDAVTSNYCYHNIPVKDRADLINETLRVLKKGGTFAIHDWFTKAKYGDREEFLKKLRDKGYEKVELIDTANGLYMTRKEAISLSLIGSGLLVGKK